ncbi:GntR family transcriptional regulator [Robertmurraya siralis]|uniref:GntR family transcriptional regulator n=1 Tax=Robertmurraya siralis TaxID=77777 RepID=A0A919WDY1_9BACI|nr:GntR family transcriptional regulator [Robertmurraya siralis]PAE21661.1 GntR family transcriptional regulator [Bacillus sp. 7504-2]GIN60161.1 GntR family transcriptional regulator [Robertmurraya siralis]
MNSEAVSKKIYIEIVKKIRMMIDEDGLKPGDKIPSERELSERLQVGRSSVREALRAIELLGLIETRRGEGTFLRDARGNQMVQLLSTFILQDQKAVKDLKDTIQFIEMDCLRVILQRNNDHKIAHYRQTVEVLDDVSDDEFFLKMMELANNHLLYRIWVVLNDFYRSVDLKKEASSKPAYLAVLDALMAGEEKEVIEKYKKLRKLL